MKLSEQIDHKLKMIEKFLLILTLLIGDLEYFSMESKNRKEIFLDYKILLRIWHGLYVYTILELNKIYNENENYSLFKLINMLINKYQSINWINRIRIEKLRDN